MLKSRLSCSIFSGNVSCSIIVRESESATVARKSNPA